MIKGMMNKIDSDLEEAVRFGLEFLAPPKMVGQNIDEIIANPVLLFEVVDYWINEHPDFTSVGLVNMKRLREELAYYTIF